MANNPTQGREEALKHIREEEAEDIAKTKAQKLGLTYINLGTAPVNLEALKTIPELRARAGEIVVFNMHRKEFSVAVYDPENEVAKELLSELKKFGKIKLHLTSRQALEFFFTNYRHIPREREKLTGRIEIPSKLVSVTPVGNLSEEIGGMVNSIGPTDVTEKLKIILAFSIRIGASDIHIEPEAEDALVRFRIDGVLHEVMKIDFKACSDLRNRLKLLSQMLINIQDRPQDGRFSVGLGTKDIEVRVSSVPGAYGENMVLRLLDPDKIALDMETLGLQERDLNVFLHNIQRPNGMIISTGPTGSGKTTTLYSFLKKKLDPGIKIVTIEDPVEYHLEGVNQTQIDKRHNYDFATALRSIMRQDPDVILVGEIRDNETATTAVNAALTGHLVFSTLHTNDAIGTVARFSELGVDVNNLTSALNLIIGQRLVRRLCPVCKEAYEPSEKEKERIMRGLTILSPKAHISIPETIDRLWKAKGCADCWGLGYKGLVGIFEYFEMNKRLQELIMKGITNEKLREIVIDEGLVPLMVDGYLKALQGTTDLAELDRVAGEVNYIDALYDVIVSQKLQRGFRVTKDELKKIETAVSQKQAIGELLDQSPQNQWLKIIFAGAVASRATDVHMEPQEKDAVIRFRIDGILNDVATLSLSMYPPLIAEVKLAAGMATDIHNKIQEGRFEIFFPGEEKRDARVSIIPGGYGEAVATRILSSHLGTVKLTELGIRREILPQIEQEIQKTNGIILVGGPTGSGKTTTLYALLSKINQPGVKIITVEDPIEYAIEGITQTQVDENQGYTFAKALRALLRQNPNILMVGETRDDETAQLAMQASLTGHLIFTTIHAIDASGTIVRLRNFKIPNGDIASGVITVMAQRLVRKVCDKCKKVRPSTKEETQTIKEILKNISPLAKSLLGTKIDPPYKIAHPVGCSRCQRLGYFGQIGIFEILIPDEHFRNAITANATIQELEVKAKEAGMVSLLEDGMLKVLEGTTTLEEIKRVLSL